MIKLVRVLFASALFAIPLSLHAQEMGIVTGSASGTYIKIGENIRDIVADKAGIHLNVYPSQGSLQNVNDIRYRRGIQIGIVQSDVLAFLKLQNEDPKVQDTIDRLRVVFPLYNEEIQIIASYDFKDFDDLSKARVAVGPEGSGTFLTASVLFKATGVEPAEIVNLGGQEALSALKSGNIDAMIYVAGIPTPLFSENITADDKIHIINITNDTLNKSYIPEIIKANSYKWQAEAVNTFAVKAMLVSFDYKNNDCDNVGKLAHAIYQNIHMLREMGHPKWNDVNLDDTVPEWEQYSCVGKYLSETGVGSPSTNSDENFKNILDKIGRTNNRQ